MPVSTDVPFFAWENNFVGFDWVAQGLFALYYCLLVISVELFDLNVTVTLSAPLVLVTGSEDYFIELADEEVVRSLDNLLRELFWLNKSM